MVVVLVFLGRNVSQVCKHVVAQIILATNFCLNLKRAFTCQRSSSTDSELNVLSLLTARQRQQPPSYVCFQNQKRHDTIDGYHCNTSSTSSYKKTLTRHPHKSEKTRLSKQQQHQSGGLSEQMYRTHKIAKLKVLTRVYTTRGNNVTVKPQTALDKPWLERRRRPCVCEL